MSETITIEDGYMFGQVKRRPQTFIQWKGTDLCMDFLCECGAHCHFDGDFAYCVKCPHCGDIWEMPSCVFPRRADSRTYPHHVENAKILQADDAHCDDEGNALPVPKEEDPDPPYTMKRRAS